jgi:hypothetical protein
MYLLNRKMLEIGYKLQGARRIKKKLSISNY